MEQTVLDGFYEDHFAASSNQGQADQAAPLFLSRHLSRTARGSTSRSTWWPTPRTRRITGRQFIFVRMSRPSVDLLVLCGVTRKSSGVEKPFVVFLHDYELKGMINLRARTPEGDRQASLSARNWCSMATRTVWLRCFGGSNTTGFCLKPRQKSGIGFRIKLQRSFKLAFEQQCSVFAYPNGRLLHAMAFQHKKGCSPGQRKHSLQNGSRLIVRESLQADASSRQMSGFWTDTHEEVHRHHHGWI